MKNKPLLTKEEVDRRIEFLKKEQRKNRLLIIEAEISGVYALLEEVVELLKNPDYFSEEPLTKKIIT